MAIILPCQLFPPKKFYPSGEKMRAFLEKEYYIEATEGL